MGLKLKVKKKKKKKHTLKKITLHHHAHDPRLASGNLLRNRTRHLWLVRVLLLRVAMAAVDHEPAVCVCLALALELRLGGSDALAIVVRARLAAPENHKAVFVPCRADDRDHTRLRHAQKMVRVLYRANRIDRRVQRAVGTVLKPDRK